jgi:hypothetical protein
LVVPILLCLAWRGWVRSVRVGSPPWRNGISSATLLLLSLHWAVVALLSITVFLAHEISWLLGVREAMISLSHPLDVTTAVLAVALKRAPRIQVLLASMLMLACWPLGYV